MTDIHLREPEQPTGRTPYAEVQMLRAIPCAVVKVGDAYGGEVSIFARDVVSLKRIEEAVRRAIHDLTG